MSDEQNSIMPNSVAPGDTVEGTVLVVDGDRVSARFVELALSQHGFTVEIARDGAGAIEVLRTTTVDLIVCDTALPDMSGQQFLRRVVENSWYQHIPVFFLTAEGRVPAKVAAFRGGAYDYLTKPVDKTELAVRCMAIIHRQREQREERKKRPYSLAGEFSAMPFSDLVVMISMGQRTGTLYLVMKGFSGQLAFIDGALVHALAGNISGHAAFYRMLTEKDGRFEFDPTPPTIKPEAYTVTVSVNALLMEGARISDEAERDAPTSKAPLRIAAELPRPSSVRLLSGLPKGSSATVFEEGLSDPFTLGELQLWTNDELRDWTSSVSTERFHVLLIADLAIGAAAILALASPPSPRFVMKSMTAEPKALGLTFFLRRDAEVDIVLLDVRSASTFQASLRQLPCLIIVCPPHGDFLAAGVRGRSDLERLLEKLMPPVLIGLGNTSLQGALKALPAVVNGICTLRTFTGSLGEGVGELRALLTNGVRLWESQEVVGR